MTRVRLKGINTIRRKLADGSVRVHRYHRATGIRLEGKPGSAEFLESYARAEQSFIMRDRGTFAGLIRAYSTSPEFDALKDSTKTEYRRLLTKIETRFGDMPERALDDPRVRRKFYEWRADIHRTSGAKEGDNVLAIMSACLNWGIQNGHIAANHVAGFKRLYKADRSHIIWTPENIADFDKVAPVELLRARVVALNTGLREGDMIALLWDSYDGLRIRLKTSKTGREITIRATKELRDMLNEMERRPGQTILTNSRGKPWTSRYFQAQWRKAMTAAGLGLDLRFNDLRGTAVTRLAEAGCTVPEIASITGHSAKTASAILDRYMARTGNLSDAAIVKLENARRTNSANRLQTEGDE